MASETNALSTELREQNLYRKNTKKWGFRKGMKAAGVNNVRLYALPGQSISIRPGTTGTDFTPPVQVSFTAEIRIFEHV